MTGPTRGTSNRGGKKGGFGGGFRSTLSRPSSVLTSHTRRPDGKLAIYEQTHQYENVERPAKRARAASPDAATSTSKDQAYREPLEDECAWVDEDPQPPAPSSEKKQAAERKAERAQARKKQISDWMEQWKPHYSAIGEIMLSWEVATQPMPCKCACGKEAAYRCLECFGSAPRCGACMRTAHKNLWFHWIEHWTGTFFKRYDLASIDFVIQLGHGGEACPHRGKSVKPSTMVIGHTNGVHRCRIHYCHCPGRSDEVTQLLRERLWPASRENVRSAFSVDLLKTWHHLWLNAKISTLDFMRCIARHTDAAFPHDVQEHYRGFRLVSRLYAHLTMVKRAGVFHKLDVPGHDGKFIIVKCWYCPTVRFNLPTDWKDTPDHVKCIHRLTLSGDGNYSFQRRNRDDDVNDVSLCEDQGAFVAHKSMGDVVADSYGNDDDKVTQTCSGFKVARAQRAGKFRFVDVSGIFAVSCRHVVFRPGAVVNLISGERFRILDFALAGGLRGSEELEQHAYTFDVICMYLRGLLKRFRETFPELVPIIEDLLCCLPSFHAHAHRELCQTVYTLWNAFGFGHIHGEGVEQPWAELNPAAVVTREMTAGARQDAINDLLNFWNRMKLEKMPGLLAKQLEEAYEVQKQTTKHFAELTAMFGPQKTTEWSKMDVFSLAPTPKNFEEKEKAYASSLYVLHQTNMPSREKALDELVDAQEDGAKPGMESAIAHLRKGAAHFIKSGIKLDIQRFRLRECTALGEKKGVITSLKSVQSLPAAERSYRKALRQWRVEQKRHMPLIPHPSMDETTEGDAEGETDQDDADQDEADKEDDKEILGLPSDFNSDELAEYDIQRLAIYELKLRIGLAFDLLAEVRQGVKHSAAFLDTKKKRARGQGANTRLQADIDESRKISAHRAKEYNHNLTRIQRLRQQLNAPADPEHIESKLRVINVKNDLQMSDLTAARAAGDRKRAVSWIWSVFEAPQGRRVQPTRKGKEPETETSPSANTTSESWATKADCVQWHCARRDKMQADTQVNLIHADFRLGRTGLERYREAWQAAAEASQGGFAAYAHQQVDMYSRMRDAVQDAFDKARKPGLDPEALDNTMSLRPHLRMHVDDVAPFEDMMQRLHMA